MITNFSLDNFRITDTRSRHEDTDFVAAVARYSDRKNQGKLALT